MSVFAIIFAVMIISLFWGGFVYMLLYTLKLKEGQDQDDDNVKPDTVDCGAVSQ